MTTNKNQVRTGIVWLITFPVIAYIAYSIFPTSAIDWFHVLLLFLILCVVMLLPIKVGEVSITLERWITITIFLQYGLFAEFVFIQLALFILLFRTKTSLPLSHKFFVNSIIFSITSLLSALAFTLFGGEIHSYDFGHVVFYGFLYGTIYTLINTSLLKLYFKLDGQPFSLFSPAALCDYLSTLVMVPMSVAFYFLTEYLGNQSILLTGIPLLVLLIALRRYKESNTRQQQLDYAIVIGRELAKKLQIEEVLQAFLMKLIDIIPLKNGYVVDLRDERILIPIMSIEEGVIERQVSSLIFTHDNQEKDGLDFQETKIYTGSKEVSTLKNMNFKVPTQAVMSIPIVREEKTEGFLILTSDKKNTFKHEDIQLLEMLTSYFAVSLEKANHYERTLNQSERCGLTTLHNYRYLDRKMDEFVSNYYAGDMESLSVVMLDIDYFKEVNDTYGHENGNIVLVKLATILKKYQKEQDVLARYGGEEFIFVFPECSKEEAFQIAEAIRADVAQTVFTITSDLDEDDRSVDLRITISLGVATLPTDALSASDLLRNVDRALYIGGKQAGRNRVGVFGQISE